MESPDARLDQEATKNAISAFQEFLDIHPESERVPDVNKLLDEMKSKLAYKEYLSAKLYYNLGNYLGNNYLAAVITAQNALKNYPTNSYKEELSYIILQAKYQQALQSVEEKKIERYRDTLDEYYNFINEYAESKFKKDADRILNDVKKVIKE
jgi:outer membrane protein assembly factor BamD